MPAPFPAFFEQHSYLPRGIDKPTALTDWEDDQSYLLPEPHPANPINDDEPWAWPEPDQASTGFLAEERTIEVDGEDARAYDEQRISELGLTPQLLVDEDEQTTSSPSSRADAIAAYLPWHFFGDGWGIVFRGGRFNQLAIDVHHTANWLRGGYLSLDRVASRVFAAILEHELFHMKSEVAGTELESVGRTSLVREYLVQRYSLPNPWTKGALEELLASWHEATADFRDLRVRAAYKGTLDTAPAGYRDYARADDDRQRRLMLRHLASRIADRPVDAVEWPALTDQDRGCVPIRWHGSLLLASAFLGSKPASAAATS